MHTEPPLCLSRSRARSDGARRAAATASVNQPGLAGTDNPLQPRHSRSDSESLAANDRHRVASLPTVDVPQAECIQPRKTPARASPVVDATRERPAESLPSRGAGCRSAPNSRAAIGADFLLRPRSHFGHAWGVLNSRLICVFARFRTTGRKSVYIRRCSQCTVPAWRRGKDPKIFAGPSAYGQKGTMSS